MNQNNHFDDTNKKLLIGSSIYQGLSESELDLILSVCELKQYTPGQTIVNAGDIGEGLYVIMEGQVKVFLPQTITEGTDEQILKVSLAKLQPGSCFGEYSLLDQKEVSATIEALTPTRLCYMPNIDYKKIVESNLAVENIIYKNLLNLLVSRLREMNLELDCVFLA